MMNNISAYNIFGLPMMVIGIINILFLIFDSEMVIDNYLIPIIYALLAASGLALFKESRTLKKEIHEVGKDHIIERINQSKIMEEAEKSRYIQDRKSTRMNYSHVAIS